VASSTTVCAAIRSWSRRRSSPSATGSSARAFKLSRFFGARDSVYVYYGRFFTPFSLENVSPLAAYTLNLPLQTSVAQFDLKPERDSAYEVGGHFGVCRGDLGVRVMQKNATDLIDDTQVGVTTCTRTSTTRRDASPTQTAYYQLGLARAGRFYAALTHTYSVNKGCETQLLAPCFGQPDDWTPADHDQRVDMTSGVIANDRRGGWLGVDAEYGSGLSSSINPDGGITCGGADGNEGGPCKRTPHLTFDAEKGFAVGSGLGADVPGAESAQRPVPRDVLERAQGQPTGRLHAPSTSASDSTRSSATVSERPT